MIPPLVSRSRTDLARWAAELVMQRGLPERGFHVLVWEHDVACPLHPDSAEPEGLSKRCHCRPNGTLVLHLGTADERRVAVVRDGNALPCVNRSVKGGGRTDG